MLTIGELKRLIIENEFGDDDIVFIHLGDDMAQPAIHAEPVYVELAKSNKGYPIKLYDKPGGGPTRVLLVE